MVSVTVSVPSLAASTTESKRLMTSAASATEATANAMARTIARSMALQLDLRHGGLVGARQFEIGPRLMPGHAGDEATWEYQHEHVQVSDSAVVVAPRHLQFVFELAQLSLKLKKIRTGLEV